MEDRKGSRENIDWPRFQKDVSNRFYRMFLRAVLRRATPPSGKKGFSAEQVEELAKIVSPLKNL